MVVLIHVSVRTEVSPGSGIPDYGPVSLFVLSGFLLYRPWARWALRPGDAAGRWARSRSGGSRASSRPTSCVLVGICAGLPAGASGRRRGWWRAVTADLDLRAPVELPRRLPTDLEPGDRAVVVRRAAGAAPTARPRAARRHGLRHLPVAPPADHDPGSRRRLLTGPRRSPVAPVPDAGAVGAAGRRHLRLGRATHPRLVAATPGPRHREARPARPTSPAAPAPRPAGATAPAE